MRYRHRSDSHDHGTKRNNDFRDSTQDEDLSAHQIDRSKYLEGCRTLLYIAFIYNYM